MLFQTLGFLVGISIPWGQAWSLPVWSQTIPLQPRRTVFLTSVPSDFLDNLSTGRPEGENRGETRVYLSDHLSSCCVLLALVPVDDLPLHGLSSPVQPPLCIHLDLGNVSPFSISHVANSHNKHYASKIPRLRSLFLTRLWIQLERCFCTWTWHCHESGKLCRWSLWSTSPLSHGSSF